MIPTYAAVLGNAHTNNLCAALGGKGHFNDADMLEIGNGQLSLAESRTHYALWCLMKSPLLIGGDLQTMQQRFIDILSNKELIAWNQDDAGIQGTFRASYPYADGDDAGQRLPVPPHPAHPATATTATAARGKSTRRLNVDANGTFGGITYCAHSNIPTTQKWTLVVSKHRKNTFALAQGDMCLTVSNGSDSGSGSNGGGGGGGGDGGSKHATQRFATLLQCDGSSAQAWTSDSDSASSKAADGSSTGATIATTIAQIKPSGFKLSGLASLSTTSWCLTVDNTSTTTTATATATPSPPSINTMPLILAPCVVKPASCRSLWWHNSSTDGIDCTDSPRVAQLWYASYEYTIICTPVPQPGWA